MQRRSFLTFLAGAVATGMAGCGAAPRPAVSPAAGSRVSRGLGERGMMAPRPFRFPAPQGIVKQPVPHGTLYHLPGRTRDIALTVDDGTNPAVLAGYATLARDTGLRLTFFCNGINRSWTEHADLLRPLVEDNQAFIANHTWSHPNLKRLGHRQITEEVRRNETFLRNTYGVSGRPFLRPPYGYRNKHIDAQLADLGYPALTMWLGSLGDATAERPSDIVANARKWFLPGRIVIGHANHRPVMAVYEQLVEVIRARDLQTVHVGDVFSV